VADADRDTRKRSFDAVAEQYDAARPAYPGAVFDDLVSLTRIPAAGRILEMGCGPGKATLPLARRGYRITCIELGENLAELARLRLAEFPLVEIVNAEFEAWDPADERFDAVAAFSSFHWLDPATRYELCASRLRSGGALAVVQNRHVRKEDGDPFWVEVQEDYDAVVPSEDDAPPPFAHEVGDLSEEIAASGLFEQAVVRRHAWDVTYSADELLAVIGTYSPMLTLDPGLRDELFDRMRRRIEARPRRTVTKTYLATLNVAVRR
jgi:SAM-dependent methyltransferase